MDDNIILLRGDITKFAADVIVNAANSSLLGGSGVDGAIHRAGGEQILAECQMVRARQGGCKVGEAVVTSAGRLPAKYVIHTVGPRWNGGSHGEPELLDACYDSCFRLAAQQQATSISFPNISTGIYRFPKPLAAEIAVAAIHRGLRQYPQIIKVQIVCFEDDNYQIYRRLIQQE
jgi:O-acetyl-ADP-ribose deacetylase (regulator of RNase III)